MNTSRERHEHLERLVDRALRGQPPLRAPASLEASVRAEIERRAAAHWWHKSFAYWPVAARVVFLAASAGCIYLGLQAALWMFTSVNSARMALQLPVEVTWIRTMLAAIRIVARDMPPLWIYGGLAALATLYAAVFGIGATAYRTLYASPLRQVSAR